MDLQGYRTFGMPTVAYLPRSDYFLRQFLKLLHHSILYLNLATTLLYLNVVKYQQIPYSTIVTTPRYVYTQSVSKSSRLVFPAESPQSCAQQTLEEARRSRAHRT